MSKRRRAKRDYRRSGAGLVTVYMAHGTQAELAEVAQLGLEDMLMDVVIAAGSKKAATAVHRFLVVHGIRDG